MDSCYKYKPRMLYEICIVIYGLSIWLQNMSESLILTFKDSLKYFDKIKQLTLVHVFDRENKKILLGLKKTGFGKGFYNGFGGKVEINETPFECAKRECKEEANIDVLNLKKYGLLYFSFTNHNELWEVHYYCTTKFNGKIKETNEMKPIWFEYKNIPYKNMWEDDIHWMKYPLNDKYFVGISYFNEKNKILNYQFTDLNDKKLIDQLVNNQFIDIPLDFSKIIGKKSIKIDNENNEECKENL